MAKAAGDSQAVLHSVTPSHARVSFGRYVTPCVVLVASLGLLALGVKSLQGALQDAGPSMVLSLAAIAAALVNLSGMGSYAAAMTGPLCAARREKARTCAHASASQCMPRPVPLQAW